MTPKGIGMWKAMGIDRVNSWNLEIKGPEHEAGWFFDRSKREVEQGR